MVKCECIAGFGVFDPAQSWPEPHDAEAVAHMRAFVADRDRFLAPAAATALIIKERFGVSCIRKRLLAAVAA